MVCKIRYMGDDTVTPAMLKYFIERPVVHGALGYDEHTLSVLKILGFKVTCVVEGNPHNMGVYQVSPPGQKVNRLKTRLFRYVAKKIEAGEPAYGLYDGPHPSYGLYFFGRAFLEWNANHSTLGVGARDIMIGSLFKGGPYLAWASARPGNCGWFSNHGSLEEAKCLLQENSVLRVWEKTAPRRAVFEALPKV